MIHMKYDIKNLHNKPRGYNNEQGQQISFAPYEEKKSIKSTPPEDQELWQVEALEQTAKPEDTELKSDEEDDDDGSDEDGGDN